MEYLTTHDLVWINQSITGKTNAYHYFNLEASMAGQYSYGDSQDIPSQAANLLGRLIAKAPFEDGNVRTAYIAVLTFLNANGYATKAEDPLSIEIIRAVATGERAPAQAVLELASPAAQPLAGGISLRTLISHECNLHSAALKALAISD